MESGYDTYDDSHSTVVWRGKRITSILQQFIMPPGFKHDFNLFDLFYTYVCVLFKFDTQGRVLCFYVDSVDAEEIVYNRVNFFNVLITQIL